MRRGVLISKERAPPSVSCELSSDKVFSTGNLFISVHKSASDLSRRESVWYLNFVHGGKYFF
jgi:hypothetical protein